MNIRVTIFEDHKSVIDALKQLVNLTPGFFCAGAYRDAENVIGKIKESNPDVILMDIQMPGIHGIDAVREIKLYFPDAKIIMQTVFDDDENIFSAICAGASGYVLKNTSPEKLVEAITEAYHGGAPMTGKIATRVLNLFKSNLDKRTTSDSNLSEREREVLGHLVKGLSYKMIADKCNITYDTVRFHIKNIYAKLHVASMTEAVAKAIHQKLV